MTPRLRLVTRWWIAIAVFWAAALVAAPPMITAAYDQRLWPLNSLLSGRTAHDVDFYLSAWRQLALVGTAALLGGAILVPLMLRYERRIKAAFGQGLERLPELRDADVLVIASALAFVGGFVEPLRWIIDHFLLHRVTPRATTLDLLWMTPVSALATLLILALIVNALSRAGGKRAARVRGVGATVLCFVALYSTAAVMPLGIHAYARAVLCLGVATLFMGALRERTTVVLRRARRGAIAGAIVVVLCMALLPVVRSVRYRNSFSATAAAREGAPNVILIVWDTVRAASMSLYGYERPTTPNLDRLAQRSIVFERAVSAASWTLPSHASMFTGLYHHQHSADRGSPLEESALTLAEYLRSNAYQTAGFIGNTYWVGTAFGLGQGFGWYEDRPLRTVRRVLLTWRGSRFILGWIATGETRTQLDRIPAEHSHTSLLRWLDDRDEDRPFFAFLNEFDAHEPYLPPSGEFRFSSKTPRYRWNHLTDKRRWSHSERRDLNEAYDACIYYLDQELGKLHAELERRGLLENTVVVLTADHGETLGEHDERLLGHAQNAYYDVLNVPLVFYWPSRIAEGRRVDQLVSLVDLPATLADVVNDGAAQQKPFPGTSLWPLILGKEPVAASPALSQVNPADYHKSSNVWPTASGSLHSLVGKDGYHYIANTRGREQLFDVRTDPWERNDLSMTPAGKAVIARYREEMSKLIPHYGVPASE